MFSWFLNFINAANPSSTASRLVFAPEAFTASKGYGEDCSLALQPGSPLRSAIVSCSSHNDLYSRNFTLLASFDDPSYS